MKKRRKRKQSEAPRGKKRKTPAVKQTEIAISSVVRDNVKLRREILVALFLVVMVLIPYGQVAHFDFVNFDDNLYITENSRLSAGLTYENIVWAFTTGEAANWHPLTWLSYLFDAQLFGATNAAAFHLTNVLFHAINSVLLFLLLHRMTRALWPSMLVAALFAVHPLHVESVAWISERKDVLSTFFWLLTMMAYVRYVASPGPRYLLVVLPFVLGLMAKPMLVTLPAVLLLMDYWPLCRLEKAGRMRSGPTRRWQWLVIEKLPLVMLAIVSSAITILVQQASHNIIGLESLPIWLRAANAVVAYAQYMVMMVLPINLAMFYPHPGFNLPFWQVIVSGAILVAISAVVVWLRESRPYLPIGWFWYLGTLIPVIGVIQTGDQSLADRYTYVPLIGLFVMAIWTIQDLSLRWRIPKIAIGFGACAMLVALTVGAAFQVSHWRNSTTLCEHALRVMPSNYFAHNNLGAIMLDEGRFDEAKPHFIKALEVKSDDAAAHDNLGRMLINEGNYGEARSHLLTALELNPDSYRSYSNLGAMAVLKGHYDEAEVQFMKALELKPDFAEALNNLGVLYANQGRSEEAQTYFKKALKVKPTLVDARSNLDRLEAADTAPNSGPKGRERRTVPPMK